MVNDEARRTRNRAELERLFESLYSEHAEGIFNYALRMMGNEFDAADLTQDTFVKAYVALQRDDREYQLRPWLYRIATNACLDELRRRGVIRWQALDVLLEGFSAHQPVERDTPERVLAYVEDINQVRETLDKLNPRHRLVLLLREQQELSYEEICQVLDKPMPAVKSLLFRAREEFKRVYLRDHPEALEA